MAKKMLMFHTAPFGAMLFPARREYSPVIPRR